MPVPRTCYPESVYCTLGLAGRYATYGRVDLVTIADSSIERLEDHGDYTFSTTEAAKCQTCRTAPRAKHSPICTDVPWLALAIRGQDTSLGVEDPLSKADNA